MYTETTKTLKYIFVQEKLKILWNKYYYSIVCNYLATQGTVTSSNSR